MKRYAIFLCDGGPHEHVDPKPDCPNAANHTYGPLGYGAWHEWAAKMAKTHVQSQCAGCGLWLIATPRSPQAARGVVDLDGNDCRPIREHTINMDELRAKVRT